MRSSIPACPCWAAAKRLRHSEALVQAFEGPTAMVWGTRDPILGRALRRQERLLPHAPVTLTTAGHFLQEEVPHALASAIDDVAARAQIN